MSTEVIPIVRSDTVRDASCTLSVWWISPLVVNVRVYIELLKLASSFGTQSMH